MSGHSKWSNIKYKKAAEDVKRGKIFTKLIKEITIATRIGGKDPDSNPRLRIAIDRARSANMPRDNIDRAIKKGSGELGGVKFENIVYEGYATAGIAVLVFANTDNKNRTASIIRSAFNKFGGNLGETGCVNWMFEQKGVISFDLSIDEDSLMEKAIEAGALDIKENKENNCYDVYTDPKELYKVVGELEKQGLKSQDAFLDEIPQTKVELSEEDKQKVRKLVEKLDELDDVDDVYTNCDLY
ncbi:MAG: putative transcriptional regulatory protein [bacterium]|nr:MAG: putative transcriptional regulatory protein [bacterium]